MSLLPDQLSLSLLFSFFDLLFFFCNDTATTEIYPLSLHDALPIWATGGGEPPRPGFRPRRTRFRDAARTRSEEHTSELQSRQYLACRLLREHKTADGRPHGPTAGGPALPDRRTRSTRG